MACAKQGKRRNKTRESVLGCNMVYGLCSGNVVVFVGVVSNFYESGRKSLACE